LIADVIFLLSVYKSVNPVIALFFVGCQRFVLLSLIYLWKCESFFKFIPCLGTNFSDTCTISL